MQIQSAAAMQANKLTGSTGITLDSIEPKKPHHPTK